MKKKLWGGRFAKTMDPYFENFSSSIQTDWRLVSCDLIGSFLHVHVLKGAGLLKPEDFSRLTKAILELLRLAEGERFPFDFKSEDIHTNIQNLLNRKAGEAGLKLQTCRSRNDQVVFATKLYCLLSAERIQDLLFHLQKGFLALGGLHSSLVIPGYTHMQHAQPVYFKDYLSAYADMFGRDAHRLEDAMMRLDISMGSGALAGTPIPASVYKAGINSALKALKMPGLLKLISSPKNAMSVVSDRDFIIEFLNVLAIAGMHISRLAEDLILWSTLEFGFMEIGDEYCTGSSLMPQKKNPDALELMRGAAGLLNGNLVSVLSLMKGLPLSYNRDMQWDKGPLFESLELVEDELILLIGLVPTLKVKKENIESQLQDESLCATELADYLVSQGTAFAQAHQIIGRLVSYAAGKSKKIARMSQEELDRFSPKLKRPEVLKRLNPVFAAAAKKSVRG
ncbi:MAG: argininosuccinate lyase [Candidatus Omnitrophota bacterium]